jgi:predicted MFS family arabinose efflux permease
MRVRSVTATAARHDARTLMPAVTAFICTGALYGSWAVAGADIERHLDYSHGQYGAFLAVVFAFMAIGHYAGAPIDDRFGTPRALVGLLATQGLILVATPSTSGSVFVALLLLVMTLAGATNTVMNATIIGGEPGFVVRFHAWFNLGALLGAATVAVATQAGHDWRAAWVAVGIMSLIASPLARSHAPRTTRPPPAPRTRLLDLVRTRDLAIVAALFLIETAVESSVDTWGVLSLRDELAVSVLVGTGAFAVGQGLAIVARAAVGPRISGDGGRGPGVAAATAAIGLLLVALTSSAGVGATGLALAVMGMAVSGPLLLARAARGVEHPAAVVGAVQASAMVGFVAGPSLVGLVASTFGIDQAMLALSATAAVLAFASTLTAARR